MNRSTNILICFVMVFAMAFVMISGTSQNAMAEKQIVWKMAHKLSPASAEGQGLQMFADIVDKKSNGRMRVDVYPMEQLGKTEASLEMLRAGTIQMYPEEIGYLQRYVPELKVFYLSFVYRDYEHWKKFIESDMVKGWRDRLRKDFNIIILASPAQFRRGPYRVFVCNKPILGLKDLQGVKMRMYPDETAVAIWKSLGADPMILAWTEVYESIKRGIIGAVTSPMGLVESMNFTEVARFVVQTNEYPQGLSFMVNAKDFYDLPPDLQQLVLDAYAEVGKWHTDLVERYAEESLSRMQNKNNVVFIRPPMNEWIERMSGIYPKWVKEGKLPEGVLDYIASIE